jgi:hypothetical protein
VFERKIKNENPNWSLIETKSLWIMVFISKNDKKSWQDYII